MNTYNLDLCKDSGVLPLGWTLNDFGNKQAPQFKIKNDAHGTCLSLSGSGDPSASAYISTKIRLEPGTYSFEVRFSLSADVNPQRNLLFQCRGDTHDGIFKFFRIDAETAEGRDTIIITGEKKEIEIRIYYRFNAGGEVKLRQLFLKPAESVKPRWVRFACTSGGMNRKQMISVAAEAADDNADLLLYPETVNQNINDGSDGDSVTALLSELAARHGMYTAASVYSFDKDNGRRYNRGILYDRQGKLAGVYDKIHLYSPETTGFNICPGTKTEIFKTDFGKIGMIICYDSWFTDVTELLALKGAELILFPAAGYYRSLIPARAADNRVRFVISVLNGPYGIFDTAGRDVEAPEKDPTVNVSDNVHKETFKDIRSFKVDGIGLLCASLDLNCSISPHYNGGKMLEAPGGKRNRTEQIIYLDEMIKTEKERWWEND